MQAMQLTGPDAGLTLTHPGRPRPAAGEVLIRVHYCGVCRTDLHILDGELPSPGYPVTPGHEVIGEIVEAGIDVAGLPPGQIVGVPWLGRTCGQCRPCRQGRENLCDRAEFTGYTRAGGYAEYLVADANYVFALPDGLHGPEAAPLMCAGLIGYRTLSLAGDGIQRLGLYGFGAAAHLVLPVARHRGMEVYAFTRPGDADGQAFARDRGCDWAGDADRLPPAPLDAALIFAPVGALVPQALKAVDKGGRVVCGGIHMSDIPAFPYRDLWQERQILSVANLTRHDGEEFLALAAELGIRAEVTLYPLAEAGRALDDLRAGRLNGAAVLDLGAGAPTPQPG